MRGDCQDSALGAPSQAFGAIPARRGRIAARDHDQAQLHRLPRRSRWPDQPITFDGDPWRSYIPLRLPWTLCVRDRTPPGSAAVLINRAHTYPDLAFPIDAAQERLFAAIDGNRSIAKILEMASTAPDESGVRRFFEQLWQYDQIVFDLTGLG